MTPTRSCESHMAMLAFKARGVPVVDYGNNIRQMAFEAGVGDAFDYPGFVPAYIRDLFCVGKGPFRWAALSGDPEDVFRTDEKVKALVPDDPHLHRWLDMARERITFQGLPLRTGTRAEAADGGWLRVVRQRRIGKEGETDHRYASCDPSGVQSAEIWEQRRIPAGHQTLSCKKTPEIIRTTRPDRLHYSASTLSPLISWKSLGLWVTNGESYALAVAATHASSTAMVRLRRSQRMAPHWRQISKLKGITT